ncbi:hypothetical protein B0H17DRAFT_1200293 [Mycena rosella]|uniref:Uncharacterized protein n=1 Tax=Mycena rosella TaxID=1033263 RepID=A0AAD7DJC2_MYCRO|nr:hypothetical protein B0H17DRAFT_1200293 [Mycena rosella]
MPTFGFPHLYVRQLFQTVVVPCMEYALPVWYKPVSANADVHCSGMVCIAKALGKVQRLACKVIIGALRITATDSLEFHVNLLPVHICLNRSVFNAAVRLNVAAVARAPSTTTPPSTILAAYPVLHKDFEMIDPHLTITPVPPGSRLADWYYSEL